MKYDRDVLYQTLEYLRDYQDRIKGHTDLQDTLAVFDDMQSIIDDLLEACGHASNSLRAYLGGDLSSTMANRSEELLRAARAKAIK